MNEDAILQLWKVLFKDRHIHLNDVHENSPAKLSIMGDVKEVEFYSSTGSVVLRLDSGYSIFIPHKISKEVLEAFEIYRRKLIAEAL